MKIMLGICTALSLTLVANIAQGAFGQTVPPPPRQGTDINVINSPNSVAAGKIEAVNTDQLNVDRVDQMTVNMAPRRDAVGLQLAATLGSFSRTMTDGLQQAEGTASYVFMTATPRPGDGSDFYFILVGIDADEELSPQAERCSVRRGVEVAGYMGTGVPESSGARVSTRLMGRGERPILEAICRGLRLPASSLAGGGTGDVDNETLTVYDSLSRGSGLMVIALMPERMMGNDFETSLLHYWKPALLMRYHRLPDGNTITNDPAMYGQLAGVASGGTATYRVPGFGAPGVYPEAARREFGERLDRLDAEWLAYLAQSAVTIRGVQHPLLNGGRPARVIPTFTMSQVGSPEFWRASNDGRLAITQLNCVASHFLHDRGYLGPEDSANLRQCPLDEIRVRARQ
ncbi:MAG: hypothetical protein QOJ53_813 [Sphingomonadales bacterium]|jgi:hypothetical protein|nr:hypothetical protein [Sphingomonadales bacterium]